MLNPTEEQEHLEFMDWVRLHPEIDKYLIHIPNGGSRHKAEAVKLKRMGVKAGVSDFFIAWPTSSYYGLWMELKRKCGKPTKEQSKWLHDMYLAGYKSIICYGCDDAIQEIKKYFYARDK